MSGTIHEISISGADLAERLLGRGAAVLDNTAAAELICGRVCMITGGGGSIGSELTRQLAAFKPKQLVIVDIYENNAYALQQELCRTYGSELDVTVQIASVRDKKRLRTLFETFKPHMVFHAAAHKHVPLMEASPEEAVKNNIFGTLNTAELACEYEAEKFILVSTDKAVNPSSVMGATKRCCELITNTLAHRSNRTVFSSVRFGNVLGSSGSVLPLFEAQLAAGGPLTVTDPHITRYFMTISEAVSLILQSAAMAEGGEVFVLDMGEPVSIYELAVRLIELHGKVPGRDIKIEFTELRPGEKLHEELLTSSESIKPTANTAIFTAEQEEQPEDNLFKNLELLRAAAENGSRDEITLLLHKLVPTYRGSGNSEVKEALK